MNNPFLAKTKPKVETIVEHTEKLYEQFNVLKSLYPNIKNLDWGILEIACLYHDLGKMNTKFQNKLIKKLNKSEIIVDDLKGINEVPHGYLSPAFLPKDVLRQKYSEDELRILYQSIYYHHTREKLENNDELKETVKKDLEKHFREFKFNNIGEIKQLYPSYVKYIRNRIPSEEDNEQVFYQYIMTKGLLNKIDYAASAHIVVEEKNEDLYEKTLSYLKKGGHDPNDLQKYMIKNSEKNNIVVASTGIGKTEAALFWIGNNKGFFTLPLKVSINAIYDRIVQKINFSRERTGLLHSETSLEYLKRNNNELDMEYVDKTRQLSLPVTVCTLDQLVDFIFKYQGFELKFATLAYSKLVIDEIQMYSPELVAYLIVAIKYITEIGGKFSIFTATFPPIFEDLIREENIDFNKPDEPFYKRINNKVQLRHKVKILQEDININDVKVNYKDKKILIIVNTVKQAQKLYDELKEYKQENKLEDMNINLFHSKFIKNDRAKKECEILDMGRLDNNKKGIWITTQVVEASLDIDFDVLYTELSDISGLFQRMGRVYRNRDLIKEYTNVYVYIGNNKNPSGISKGDKSIIDYEIFNISKKVLLRYGYEDFELDENEKMKMVEETYSKDKIKDTMYYQKIVKTIRLVKDIKEYDLLKKDINLRNITNRTIMPKVIYLGNKSFIENNLEIINKNEDYNKKLIAKNAIKALTLTIPEYEYEFAFKNSLVSNESIEIDKYNIIPVIKFDYDFEKGLEKPKNITYFDESEQFI